MLRFRCNRIPGFFLALVIACLLPAGCSTESTQAEVTPPIPKENEVLKTFAVEGMTCEGCEAHVSDELRKVPGVKEARASHTAKKAWVITEKDGPSNEKLVAAIQAAGEDYKVQPAGN